ncbi:hypothetical protein WG66_006592 [Moniliophthora roreri]|nr:hypothetical protein WG66_006592 [Moniliophthora roreri]
MGSVELNSEVAANPSCAKISRNQPNSTPTPVPEQDLRFPVPHPLFVTVHSEAFSASRQMIRDITRGTTLSTGPRLRGFILVENLTTRGVLDCNSINIPPESSIPRRVFNRNAMYQMTLHFKATGAKMSEVARYHLIPEAYLSASFKASIE